MMIQVEHLTRHYGPTVALDDVSFAIERGEIVGFLGPNGAGKSTTMRILTGYLPATSGRASIAGYDAFHHSIEVRRRVGYLPEGVPLYPEMRVEEYLGHRAAIKGIRRAERRRRVEGVLERCDIRDVRRKLIGSLSKGYRQRVGLAEALIHDPPVLILDEPTVGLDPNQVRQVRQLIRELGQDRTVLLSTHILTEVEMVCSRVLIIRDGRLVFQDRLDHIARGGEGVQVFIEGDLPDAAITQLRIIPGVLDARLDGVAPVRRVYLHVEPGSDVREEVFRHAARQGWVLRELRLEQPTLEDIFVRLTAKEGADA